MNIISEQSAESRHFLTCYAPQNYYNQNKKYLQNFNLSLSDNIFKNILIKVRFSICHKLQQQIKMHMIVIFIFNTSGLWNYKIGQCSTPLKFTLLRRLHLQFKIVN